MPRGGYRPNAGRPKGSTKASIAAKKAATKLATAPKLKAETTAEPTTNTSLDYLMQVIRGEVLATSEERLRAAIAALPFQHPKLAEAPGGKKTAAQDAAKTAGAGRFAPPSAPKLVADNTK